MTALNAVHSVAATAEADVYILSVNITDAYGETYDCTYASRPDDSFGLNPAIRSWLVENLSSITVVPYVPPTAQQIRAGMSPITRRQLRLALVRNGISIASVDAAIAGMPNGQEKDEATIEWQDATTFDRMHPTLLFVGGALGLSPDAIDAMWAQAAEI